MVKTFQQDPFRVLHTHHRLLPSLGRHLQAVSPQLHVQQVIQGNGSALRVVDFEEVVDHLSHLSSCQQRETFLLLKSFGHLDFIFELGIHGLQ